MAGIKIDISAMGKKYPTVVIGTAALLIVIALVIVVAVFGKSSVTFKDIDGTVISTEKVKKSDRVVEPLNVPAPPEGYAFDCWVGADGEPFDFNAPIKGRTVISPKYVKVYSVNFYIEDILLEERVVQEFELVSDDVKVPEKENMSFVAWMNGSGEYEFDTPVTSDLHLTAAYKKFVAATSMSVNCEVNKLTVGETNKIVCKLIPDNTTEIPTFESSNPGVLKVDEFGRISAVSEGITDVKVSTSGQVDSLVFIVYPAPAQVILSKETEGGRITLTAEVRPENVINKEVKWTSADKKIATVDEDGKVIGVKEGTVVITAETYNGIKAESKVTVKAAAATGVKLSHDSIVLDLLNTNVNWKKLTFKVSPDNAEQKVKWSVTDSSILKVDENGSVTALKAGKAAVVAATDNGKTAACSVTVIKSAANIYFDVTYGQINNGENYDAASHLVFLPDRGTGYTVTWASSNPNVATVNAYGIVMSTGPSLSPDDYANITATCRNEAGSTTVTLRVYVNGGILSVDGLPKYGINGNPIDYGGKVKFTAYTAGMPNGNVSDVSAYCIPVGMKKSGNTAMIPNRYTGSTEVPVYFTYNGYTSNTVNITVEPEIALEVISDGCQHPTGSFRKSDLGDDPRIVCTGAAADCQIEVKCNIAGCEVDYMNHVEAAAFEGDGKDRSFLVQGDQTNETMPGIINYKSPGGQVLSISITG